MNGLNETLFLGLFLVYTSILNVLSLSFTLLLLFLLFRTRRIGRGRGRSCWLSNDLSHSFFCSKDVINF